MKIDIARINKLTDGKLLLGFSDIIIDDCLLIKGLRIIGGKKVQFVSMPQEQGKDGRWYNSIKCLNKEVQEEIFSKVMEAYNKGE